jgi:hypothetical protein
MWFNKAGKAITAAEEAQSLFRNLVHKTRDGLAKSEEKRSYAEAELIFTC